MAHLGAWGFSEDRSKHGFTPQHSRERTRKLARNRRRFLTESFQAYAAVGMDVRTAYGGFDAASTAARVALLPTRCITVVQETRR